MSQSTIALDELKSAMAASKAAQPSTAAATAKTPANTQGTGPVDNKPKIDAQGRAYGTGRRKESVARVWIKPGQGAISINGRTLNQYFGRGFLQGLVLQPFQIASREGQFDVYCTVKGGGLSGQAGAIRHGISRAMINFEPTIRTVLKKAGMLTRDSREVERKKYGRPKARRSFQFSKR